MRSGVHHSLRSRPNHRLPPAPSTAQRAQSWCAHAATGPSESDVCWHSTERLRVNGRVVPGGGNGGIPPPPPPQVHGAMAGLTAATSGIASNRAVLIPFSHVRSRKVDIKDRDFSRASQQHRGGGGRRGRMPDSTAPTARRVPALLRRRPGRHKPCQARRARCQFLAATHQLPRLVSPNHHQ